MSVLCVQPVVVRHADKTTALLSEATRSFSCYSVILVFLKEPAVPVASG